MSPPIPSQTFAHNIHSPAVWEADAPTLSLALMDTRNAWLALHAQIEAVQDYPSRLAQELGLAPPVWTLGAVGWYQERWTVRNLLWRRGQAAASDRTPLSSIEPLSDEMWSGVLPARALWTQQMPSSQAVKAYLLETLELTLEVMERAERDDAALYFFRDCLHHEDRCLEQRLVECQMLGLSLPVPALPGMAARPPLGVSGQTWVLGREPRGYVPEDETGRQACSLPAFEIDAQPVSWSQYAEFVDDGGYDNPAWWSEAGWRWLQAPQASGGMVGDRRAPRYVEQMGHAAGAVLQARFGRLTRVAGSQPVLHVSAWEADAYARWAGRRLPSEAEWELAAMTVGRLGWHWGDVREWTASTYQVFPGFVAGPTRRGTLSEKLGVARVVKGASCWSARRLHHPKQRLAAFAHQDELFVGFRTCAL